MSSSPQFFLDYPQLGARPVPARLPLEQQACCFCDHINPTGAKFCNECGSPLHLKPCNQCKAVDDRAATTCSKCGAEFPMQRTATEAVPASAVQEAAADSGPSSEVEFEHGHTPFPESAVETLDVLHTPTGNETAEGHEHGEEVIAREPRSLGRHVTTLLSAAQRATHLVPLHKLVATSGQHQISRAAFAAVLLGAVAIAAYYVYRHPIELGDWLGARQSDRAVPAAAAPHRTASPAIPAKIGVGPSSSPAVSASTTTPIVGAPPAATAIVAEPPSERMPATDQRVGAKQAATHRSTTTYQAADAGVPVRPRKTATPVNVPPDVPRVGVCTEAVAALGLCNSSTREERK